jgi:glycosyltransferase involved in cell wall biosynthesis
VFFWQRRNELTWREVARLLAGNPVESVHLHRALDPGGDYVPPSAADRERYRIEETDWFEAHADYRARLERCDVVVAPRVWEGIGMTFLEAMALGKCVIAARRPTHDEYLEDGVNGVLFDPEAPGTVDLSRWPALGTEARRSIERGHRRWCVQAREVLDEVEVLARRRPWRSWFGRFTGRMRGAHA